MVNDQPTDPPASFEVRCRSCAASYDAMTAPFCHCVATERSLVCPSCFKCSCDAPRDYKRKLWTGAPRALWDRKLAEHQVREAEPPNPAPEDVRRPLVLLVDDEADIRRLLHPFLSALGYGIVVGRNGEEALELARRYRPDVVLTDALMPKLDGRDLCRRIKDDQELAQTKVVVMTSLYTGVKYETQGYRVYGADDYLVKPVDLGRLKATLEKHLGA